MHDHHDCPQVSIFRVEGPFFFGAVQTFKTELWKLIHLRPKVLILRLGKVPFMDTTGENDIPGYCSPFPQCWRNLIDFGNIPQTKRHIQKNGLYEEIGEKHFFDYTGGSD